MAIVSVALLCRMEGGTVSEACIGLGGAARTPVRATAAERAIAGKKLDRALARDAGRIAAQADAQPVSDHRAGEAYRRQLVAVLTERAVLAVASSGNGSL